MTVHGDSKPSKNRLNVTDVGAGDGRMTLSFSKLSRRKFHTGSEAPGAMFTPEPLVGTQFAGTAMVAVGACGDAKLSSTLFRWICLLSLFVIVSIRQSTAAGFSFVREFWRATGSYTTEEPSDGSMTTVTFGLLMGFSRGSGGDYAPTEASVNRHRSFARRRAVSSDGRVYQRGGVQRAGLSAGPLSR